MDSNGVWKNKHGHDTNNMPKLPENVKKKLKTYHK